MADPKPHYTFLPWFRQGIATDIKQIDALNVDGALLNQGRASTRIDLQIKAKDVTRPVSKTVELYGPGDVTGIEARAIIKTEPRAGLTNFEANYLPYIEFYDEDFPWRYTPANPGGLPNDSSQIFGNPHRLRPWLALIVLEEDEFTFDHTVSANQSLPKVFLKAGALNGPFPPADQTWAWAHVHVNKKLGVDAGSPTEAGLSELSNLLNSQPNRACSRLLCPRRLKQNKHYQAFLIPAFEQGRLAGLNAGIEKIRAVHNLLPSWGHPHDFMPDFWPVYYQWSFKTSDAGDFEQLLRKIVPRRLDPKVGRRLVDIQNPGWGLRFEGEEAEANSGTILREGAVVVPDLSDAPGFFVPNPEESPFVQSLADLINLEEELKEGAIPPNSPFRDNPFYQEEEEAASIYDDPIVTPPFYGKSYQEQKKVDPAALDKWYNSLNLHPKNRISAGMGTQVIQKDQEELMDRAWNYFGDVLAANQKLRRMQLSLELSEQIYKKHLKKLDTDRLLTLSHQLHGRMKFTNEQSVNRTLQVQALPKDVFGTAYNRAFRYSGPYMKRIHPNKRWAVHHMSQGEHLTFVGRQYDVYKEEATDRMPEKMWYPNWMRNKPMPTKVELGTLLLSKSLPSAFDTRQFTAAFKAEYGLDGQVFMDALGFLMNNWARLPKAPKPPLPLSNLRLHISAKLNPRINLVRKTYRLISQNYEGASTPINHIDLSNVPIQFPEPMYEALRDLSPDYFVPNLHLIPDNTFGLLETNQAFLESYLLGLNQEMAREFLWREYPTSLQSTYFRQFWDVIDNPEARDPEGTVKESFKDIKPILEWPPESPLGSLEHSPKEEFDFIYFTHYVTTSNIPDAKKNSTILNHHRINGRPNLLLFITEYNRPLGDWNDSPMSVSYDQNLQKWTIYNHQNKAMRRRDRFNVLAVDPQQTNKAFVHSAFGNIFRPNRSTTLNHPTVNGKPNLILLVSTVNGSNSQPPYVNYSGGRWRLNVSYSGLKKYNILALAPGTLYNSQGLFIGAFQHSIDRANREANWTVLDSPYTSNYADNHLFITSVSKNGGPAGVRYLRDRWTIYNRQGLALSSDKYNVLSIRKADDKNHREARLVFAIRGELLRKYPNTLIYMQRALFTTNEQGQTKRVLAPDDVQTNLKMPSFYAQIDPDISFIGFEMNVEDALGKGNDPGWFFIIKERPGEVHFGMDEQANESFDSWDDLSWQNLITSVEDCLDLDQHFPSVNVNLEPRWGRGLPDPSLDNDPAAGTGNAADMAFILYQKPFMAAVHTEEMLNRGDLEDIPIIPPHKIEVKPNTFYYIQSKVSAHSLGTPNGANAVNTEVKQFTHDGVDNQTWKLEPAGDEYFYITSKANNMCLSVLGASTKRAIKTVLFPKQRRVNNMQKAQQWKLVPLGGTQENYYYIVNRFSNMVLDVQGGKKTSGVTVWQYLHNRTDAQKWKFLPIPPKGFSPFTSGSSSSSGTASGGFIISG